MDNILGLHHITAIAGDAKKNLTFYTQTLGLRLVKKTVNFDDPGTYHFYFGDEVGTPGTILTFFPWTGIQRGKTGSGMATAIGYSVPANSLHFWENRFRSQQIDHDPVIERFGEKVLPFRDPDGLDLELIEATATDNRLPWMGGEVPERAAIRGFHAVTLTVRSMTGTVTILTEIFGYRKDSTHGNRTRFITNSVDNASIVDIVEEPALPAGVLGGGINHHVAFRVKDEEVLMEFREKVSRKGLSITPKVDRDYFFSLYFREPGGILFEIATDNPGFTRDETKENLGSSLKLPKQYEPSRREIEKVLPSLV